LLAIAALLRLIEGLKTITDGKLEINGVNMKQRAPADRGCCHGVQSYAALISNEGRRNIEFRLRIERR